MNNESNYQLLDHQLTDLEERIIRLEQTLIYFEQCYLISLQTDSEEISDPLIVNYKLIIEQQEMNLRKLEVEYQLLVKKSEFAALTVQ